MGFRWRLVGRSGRERREVTVVDNFVVETDDLSSDCEMREGSSDNILIDEDGGKGRLRRSVADRSKADE
jgi:hypothetical protein